MPPPSIVDPSLGKATKLSWAKLVRQWIEFLFGQSVSAVIGIINSVFEQLQSGTPIIPVGWQFTAYPSGSGAVDNTTQNEGVNSFKIVIPGGALNGGGYLELDDNHLVPWSPASDLYVKWFYKTDVATTVNKVEVLWYTSAGPSGFISSSTLWSANSGQASAWTRNYGFVSAQNIPATARYFRLRATGGSVSSIAGNIWYQGFEIFKPKRYGISNFISAAGTTNFVVPDDCVEVIVELVSGGAYGSGQGGGSGAYNKIQFSVIPCSTHTVVVGAGGTNGSHNGGVSSWDGTGPGGGLGTGGGGSAIAYDNGSILGSKNGNANSGSTGGAGISDGFQPFAASVGQGGNVSANGTAGIVVVHV